MDYRWIADDPYRSYFGHPYLPAGYDSMSIGTDEVNAPGENWPVWPVYYDTFIGLSVVIMTDSMQQVFDTGCPDLIVPCENWTTVLPHEEHTLVIRPDWYEREVASQNNVLVFPREVRTQEVKKAG